MGAALAAHDASLVRWGLLIPTLPGVSASLTARFAALACWGDAGSYVSQLSVRDGVLDVPLVGFYATTHANAVTRLTTALNKPHNPPSS